MNNKLSHETSLINNKVKNNHLHKKETPQVKTKTARTLKTYACKVFSPFNGRIVLLENVPDKVFATKMLGDGIAIEPIDGKIYSPVVGEIISSFPTGHAFTIKTESNHAILLHIGIDTVHLKGKGFLLQSCIGDNVSPSKRLVQINLSLVKKHAVSIISPIILLNDPTYASGKVKVLVKNNQIVKKGQLLFVITK